MYDTNRDKDLSYFYLLLDNLVDFEVDSDESVTVFATDSGAEALEGETALMMPFFYLFDDVNESVANKPVADSYFYKCLLYLLGLGKVIEKINLESSGDFRDYNVVVTDIFPALNTRTKRYDPAGVGMTVVDMLDKLTNPILAQNTSVLKTEGLSTCLLQLQLKLQEAGGLRAREIFEMVQQQTQAQALKERLSGEQTDVGGMWEQLILAILMKNGSEKVTTFIENIKKKDGESNFKKNLMQKSLNFGQTEGAMTAYHAAVLTTSLDVMKELVRGLSDADRVQLLQLESKATGDESLRDLAIRMEKSADRDDFSLYLAMLRASEHPELVNSDIRSELKLARVREAQEKRDAREIVELLGIDAAVLTPISGFPAAYSKENVEKVYKETWSKMMQAEGVTTGQTDLARLQTDTLSDDELKSLKIDCLFGCKHFRGAPYQLNVFQLHLLENGESMNGGLKQINKKWVFGNQNNMPVVSQTQEFAGLRVRKKGDKWEYTFEQVHQQWVWANVSPLDDTKQSCGYYRLDNEGGLRRLVREALTYTKTDIQRGELVLCNLKNHEKLLDDMTDKGSVTFMDKELTVNRMQNSARMGTAAGAVGALAALPLAAPVAGFVGAGALGASLWYYFKEKNKRPDDYLYCKVVRVLDRPAGEALESIKNNYQRTQIAAAGLASAGGAGLVYQVMFNGETIDVARSTAEEGWQMVPWEEVQQQFMSYQEVAVDALKEIWLYMSSFVAQFTDINPTLFLASMAALVGAGLWGMKIKYVDGDDVLSSSVLHEGYVKAQNLQHEDKVTDYDRDTKWPERVVPSTEIKWRLHESYLRQIFRGGRKNSSALVTPSVQDKVLKYLTPTMVEGRVPRTNFEVCL